MITDDWKQLAASALIGTARQDPRLLGDAPGTDTEGKLLGLATIARVRLRAGWSPSAFGGGALTPAPSETSPVVLDGELHLHHVLRGNRWLMREWLSEAAACGVLAPASAHTALLEMALTAKSDELQIILRVLGARGKWLAELNPRWSGLFEEKLSAETWTDGSFQDRLRALRRVRGLNPAVAREMIEKAWPNEPAKERAGFLATIQAELGPGDQALLERGLSDKSIEVRRVAVSLLAQIPDNLVSRQATSIGLSRVNIHKSLLGTKIDIQLPPEETTLFDVLDEPVAGAGVRAAKLARIVGCVSPEAWLSETGRSMGELFQLVHRQEFADVVRRGFVISAVRFGDRATAGVIFANWLEKPDGTLPEVLPLVNAKRIDDARVSLIKSNSSVAPVLLGVPQPWDESTSRAFLKRYLSADQGHLGQVEASEAARRLAPETFDDAVTSIPDEMGRALKSWMEILPLRRDMIRTIRRSANR